MNNKEELDRINKVHEIHRSRVDKEISIVNATIANYLLDIDKSCYTLEKLGTKRIFLFNQDLALNNIETAKTFEEKIAAYNSFMDLFVTEQPKCNLANLKSFIGYEVIKDWLDHLINEYGDGEEDYNNVMQIIDKYYNKYKEN